MAPAQWRSDFRIPADPESEDEPVIEFSAWASPIDGRRLDVLLVAPDRTLRDAEELSKRIDLDLITVGIASDSGEEDNDPARAAASEGWEEVNRLLARKRVDVAMLANIDPGRVPTATWNAFADAVDDGIGVVIVRYVPPMDALPDALLNGLAPSAEMDAVARGLALTSEKTFHLREILRLYESAQSRLVDIAYDMARPIAHCLVPQRVGGAPDESMYVDDALALVGRALFWAARRQPSVSIIGVEDSSARGPQPIDTPPNLPERFVQAMRDNTARVPLHPFRITLDRPAPGEFDIRVQIRYPGRRIRTSLVYEDHVYEGARFIDVQAPVGLGDMLIDFWLLRGAEVVDWWTLPFRNERWPTIEDFHISKTVINSNDSIVVQFHIRPNLSRPAPTTVYIRGIDALERVVFEGLETIPPEGGTFRRTLDFVDLVTTRVRLDTYLISGTGNSLSWRPLENSSHVSRDLVVQQAAMRDLSIFVQGVDGLEPHFQSNYRALNAAGIDGIYFSEAGSMMDGPGLAGLGVIPSLNSTPYTLSAICDSGEWERHDLLDWALYHRMGQPRPAARLYAIPIGWTLQRALNVDSTCHAAYIEYLERRFSDLDTLNRQWGATHSSWADAARRTALANTLEYKTFIESKMCTRAASDASRLRREDKDARVGPDFSSAPAVQVGDLYSWSNTSDFVVLPADAVSMARMHSYLAPDGVALAAVTVDRLDGQQTAPGWLSWNALLYGMNGLLVRASEQTPTPTMAVVDGEGETASWLQELSESLRVLRRGPAAVLGAGTAAAPLVGVYDSPTSRALSILVDGKGNGARDGERRLVEFLAAEGIPFRFVSGQQLDTRTSLPRVILLPSVVALGDDEVRSLREYAVTDGVLIANVSPGLRDDFGSLRSQPPLDDVVRTGVIEDEMLRVLSEKNMTPPSDVYVMRDPEFHGHRGLFRYGKGDVLVVLASPDADKDRRRLRLRFPKDRYAYDMLAGAALGAGAKETLRLDPGEPRLFAILPYEVSRLTMTLPDVVKRGRRLYVSASIKSLETLPGDHTVHVMLEGPDGEELTHYSHTFSCPDGQGSTYIPLALNDPVGEYRLTVRDALTGVSNAAFIEVR